MADRLTRVFGVRAREAEITRWRAVSGGSLNAWIREVCNAAAEVAEAVADQDRDAAAERERLRLMVFPLQEPCRRQTPAGVFCYGCRRVH